MNLINILSNMFGIFKEIAKNPKDFYLLRQLAKEKNANKYLREVYLIDNKLLRSPLTKTEKRRLLRQREKFIRKSFKSS